MNANQPPLLDNKTADIRAFYQSLHPDKRKAFLSNLSASELEWLYANPRIFLFDKQIPPATPWRYHLYRGGRGAGKTFASTSWLYEKIINGAREVAIVGPSYSDLIKEILPTFESHFPPDKKPSYVGRDNLYRIYTGCIVKVYSSDTEIRGMNAEYAIAEEVCKWSSEIPEKIQKTFDIFELGVRNKRAKPCPQIFIASTPKPIPFFINFEKRYEAGDPLYSQQRAHTDDNKFLSQSAKDAFHNKYDGTRTGRQELGAEILTDNPNALWTEAIINKARLPTPAFNQMCESGMLKIGQRVIGIDPAVTTGKESDETGLFVAGSGSDNRVYLLEDASGRYSPDEWANKAVKLYHDVQASHIIIEQNNGGQLLESAIHHVDPYVKVKLIHASTGKKTRFEPIVMAYERGEVVHVGPMERLEEQMLSYNPYIDNGWSPDRIDAAAYTIYELLINKQTTPIRRTRNLGAW